MAFIDDAKEFLKSEEFAKLELLARKSADFDTTSEEDNELFALKKSVKEAIAKRDKEKNMSLIKEYSVEEIIEVFKPTKEAWDKMTKKLFPKAQAEISEAIAIYKIGDTNHEIKNGQRLLKELSQAVAKGKEKKFVESLTDFGKKYMALSHKAEAGPYSGSVIYDSVNAIATRLKLDKSALLKELKAKEIIKDEVKA